MKRKALHNLTQRWIKKLGIPAGQLRVAVGDKEWRAMGNEYPLSSYYGRVMDNRDGFGIARYQKRSRSFISHTIVHEIAHILWPNKPHWWVECFASKVVGMRRTGRYSRRYGHSVDDVPSRAKCLKMAQKRAKKLYQKGVKPSPSYDRGGEDEIPMRISQVSSPVRRGSGQVRASRSATL